MRSKKKTTAAACENVVYIGPSVPALGLIKNTVFANGLPGGTAAAVEASPHKAVVMQLMIPVSDFPRARAELESGEGALSLFYKEIKEGI